MIRRDGILLFMCCHPASSYACARAVGGLTTAEIARAFIVLEATIAHQPLEAPHQVLGRAVSNTGRL